MDTRLLKHYETELAFMREMGAEFAAAFPKIAARLGMQDTEVLDPYVERLLEGVAFLTSRVQLELELQYPMLAANLLEIIYPHYLAPTPSMMVVAFEPDPAITGMKEGAILPARTRLRSAIGDTVQTPCDFETAHDVRIWPIEITEVEYIDGRGPLAAAGLARNIEARAAIRLRLRRTGDGPIAELTCDNLCLFLNGAGVNPWQLLELLSAQVTAVAGRSTDRRDDWVEPLPKGRVAPVGFDRAQALLPTPPVSFDGYRLLQEYFAMPQRYHFIDIRGIGPALRRAKGPDVDIYILLREGIPDIQNQLTPEAFTLNATPAVNLFRKRCDRVRITTRDYENHIVPDRTAPLDYEIYSVESVTGISAEGEDDTVFRPFYSASDFTAAGEVHPAYYTVRRRMRQRTEKERLQGVRTSYLGSEMFLSLVDRKQAPYPPGLDQLAVQAMCTNRDLPLLLSTGAPNLFHLPEGGPVKTVLTPVPPTRPRTTSAEGDAAWRLISHLSLNYLSIADADNGSGAEALRELIGIYAPSGDRVIEKQLEGVVGVSSRPIVRRITDEVLSTAVRGLEIRITFDESFFEGSSAYLLGAVLERFFRKYVSLNSFTETVLLTQQRGEIARWKAEAGLGRII